MYIAYIKVKLIYVQNKTIEIFHSLSKIYINKFLEQFILNKNQVFKEKENRICLTDNLFF